MALSRRHLIAAAVAVPIGLAAERATRLALDGVRASATSIRPLAQGTSATRCGLCGSPDHSMLDPDCPAAKPVT